MNYQFRIELIEFSHKSVQELWLIDPHALAGNVGDRWWIDFDRSAHSELEAVRKAVRDLEPLGVRCLRAYTMGGEKICDIMGTPDDTEFRDDEGHEIYPYHVVVERD
tara:strand:+ start:275 stop:595 length:321 start_codon:yes stop_codon:yes gene_type:complete